MIKLCSLDFSITGPSLCIYTKQADKFCLDDCQFLFVSPTKKYANWFDNRFMGWHFTGKDMDSMERFDRLTDIFINTILLSDTPHIAMEGYSMGSKGLIFDIAECTGLLKYKVWQHKLNLTLFAPTEIKKFATGKGNANKNKMNEAFIKETGCDLTKILPYEKKEILSPISDIVDSYFIAKILAAKLDQ